MENRLKINAVLKNLRLLLYYKSWSVPVAVPAAVQADTTVTVPADIMETFMTGLISWL